jgi:hypothetical protein
MFFYPIGNPVSLLSCHNKKKLKLKPRGELGTLIGFNPELKSYQILTEAGVVVNPKNVTFLDFVSSNNPSGDNDKLLVKINPEPIVEKQVEKEVKDEVEIKEEEEDKVDLSNGENEP